MGDELAAKNAIVTGASRGLGERIAQALWNEGANLLLIARADVDLARVRNDLMASARVGQQALTLTLALDDPTAAERVVEAARQAWDDLDILVNNAAILGPVGRLWENDWAEWERTIRVNLLAPVALCRACVPWMRRRQRGKIVNLSGGGATGPRPNFTAYAAAKAGLVRFTETLAAEAQSDNIHVNSIAPGVMNTQLLRQVAEAGLAAGEAEVAVAARGAAGTPDSMARAADLCLFLCSARSDGISGRLISAVWDRWDRLDEHVGALDASDIYTLRRIVPGDRGQEWG